MSVAGALARGRAAHLQVMIEACTIKRLTDQTMDANDVLVDTFATVYTGQCRVKAFRTGHDLTSGQVAVMQRSYDVQLPWDATGEAKRGDVVTITASDDSWLIGRPLTLIEVNYSGTQTARHLLCGDDS